MAGHLVRAAFSLAHVSWQSLEQRAHAFGGVRCQRGFGAGETVRLRRIDVDAQDFQVAVEAPFILSDQQARADTDDHVRVLPQAMADRQGDGEAMAAVDHARPAPVGDDGRLQQFGERGHLGAGVLRAAADDDQRLLGVPQNLRELLDGVRVDRRTQGPGHFGRRHGRAPRPDIHGAFEHDRALAAGQGVRQRGGRQWRRLVRRIDAGGEFRDVAGEPDLVGNLVQGAEATVDRVGRDLADQSQHGRVHAIGCEHGRAGVEEAGAGHDREGLRLASRQRGAQGHIGAALLVAGVQETQAVAVLPEGVEQRIIVDARQAVDGIEPVRDQGFDERVRGAMLFHGDLRAIYLTC